MGLKTILSAMSMKVKIIIVCAVIAVAGGVTAAVLINAGKADTYRVLKVFELTGSAVVSRQGTGDLDAYVGMNLESGDTLMVGDGSTLRISMDGDKYVLLDSGTVLELIAEGTPSDSRTSINLKQGTILNELTTSLSANSSYEVATPKATMAVRGTSFMVSVEYNEDGSYLIRTNTFHGKVEVILLDPNGDPTGESAMVPVGKGIIIKTVPNSETGNPAEVDGTSYFVYETEDGVFIKVPDGTDPVGDIIYEYISAVIREYALRSNDDGTMVLDEYIISRLRGYITGGAAPVTTVSGNESEPITTTAPIPENEPTVTTTAPKSVIGAEAVTTSVPKTQDRAGAVTTTVPQTEGKAEAAAATVPKTEDSTKAATTTVPNTEDSTKAATTTVPKTEDKAASAVTTVPKTDDTTQATTTTAPFYYIPVTPTTTVPTTSNDTGTTTTAPETDEETEQFIVSFTADGQLVYMEAVENGGTVTNIPAVPAKTGHTGKWTYNNAEFTTSTVITGNTTVEAEYTAIEYTVTFKADGAAVSTQTVAYGQTVTTLPTIPAKTGHTGKWTYNSAEFTTSTVITGNTTVEAEYTAIDYTVTFKADGTTVSTQTVAYGQTVTTLPTIPAKTGHTGKWTYNNAEFTTSTVITGNTTVEAEYTAIDYTVTFKADGTTVSTQTVAYGQTVTTLPTIPAKTGHTGNWTYNNAEFTTSTVITGNTTVEAEYTAIDYTVTFKADGATVSTQTVAYGQTVTTLPTIPAKTGHTGKWTYNNAEFTTSTVITGNTTVEAEYTAIDYTVTYVLSADETVELTSQNVAYGSVPETVTLPTILDIDSDGTYDYYLFDWQQPTDAVTGDTVIPVTYETYSNVREVKITSADTEHGHYLAKIGDTITLPTTAGELENSVFLGWGHIGSGGYSDSSVKEGSADASDWTDDYLTYGSAEFAPGASVTLKNELSLNYSPYNFKFVAVYAHLYTVTFVDEEDGTILSTVTVQSGCSFADALNDANITQRDGYDIVLMYDNSEVDPNEQYVYGDYEIIVVYRASS